MMDEEEIKKDMCFLMLGGSHAYGTSVEGSDKDYRGVCIPKDKKYYLGAFASFTHKANWRDEEDMVVYDFRRVMTLLAKGAPGMMDMLFAKEYISRTQYWAKVQQNKHLFYSKYIPTNLYYVAQNHMPKEPAARNSLTTKKTMHAIRNMRMCIEFLTHQEMNIDRTKIDAPELIDIRNGKRRMKSVYDEMDHLTNEYKKLITTTDLPDEVNTDEIDIMSVDIIQDYIDEDIDPKRTYHFRSDYFVNGKWVPYNLVKYRMIQDLEYFYISGILAHNKGNILRASDMSDIQRRILYKMMDRTGLR
jgi:predicted nucleotidyltransferase